jgi:hypothetical protein
MIRRMLLASATLFAFVLVVPAAAQAQGLYFSAGAAFPSGDDLEDVDTGWLAAGGVTFDLGEGGVWAGIDGSYGSHGITDIDENVNTYSFMGIVGYSFDTEGNLDPYVWGGAGIQGIKDDVDNESGFGWQAGAGTSFGSPDSSIRPFVEGRYHSASIDIDGFDVDVKFFVAEVGASVSLGN